MKTALKAFTLVEIIVAIAIVIVLSGLITFAAMHAMRSAKGNVCLSQLVATHRAFELYSMDHDSYGPPYSLMRGYADLTQSFNAKEQYKKCLGLYGLQTAQWFCPLDKDAHSAVVLGEWQPKSIMSYTNDLAILRYESVATGGGVQFSLASVEEPSSFYFFLDDTRLDKVEGVSTRTSAHGTMMNTVFGDGHAKTIPVPSDH